MKLHRTPPRATYDAVPVRSRLASGDIHECHAMQYDAMIWCNCKCSCHICRYIHNQIYHTYLMKKDKYFPHMPYVSIIIKHTTYLPDDIWDLTIMTTTNSTIKNTLIHNRQIILVQLILQQSVGRTNNMSGCSNHRYVYLPQNSDARTWAKNDPKAHHMFKHHHLRK